MKPNSMRYNAADGTQQRDEGGGLLEGTTESGIPWRLRGRRTGVKKPLVAASEFLQGKLSIMDDKKGWVIDRYSKAGKAVAKVSTGSRGMASSMRTSSCIRRTASTTLT